MASNLSDAGSQLAGPRLASLHTVVPKYELPQTLVRDFAARIMGGRYGDFERLALTFETSGVKTRYSVAPITWFEEPRGWPDRTAEYLAGATKLFMAAAKGALSRAGWAASDVDTIVTVSSTGIATPTLEVRAMQTMKFRTDVQRVPVFGLGCAGGVTGLALAARLAAGAPGAKVLLVVVETCTLCFRSDRFRNADIIATVLFGDGAAAACVTTDIPTGPVIGQGVEHTWHATMPIMGWDVDETGFGVIFDRSIPGFAHKHFAEAVHGGLEQMGLAWPDINRLVCHPGGAKVIEAIETSMTLAPGKLDHERDILRDYGNMSAPTALFVLERHLATTPTGSALLVALGPGFTASMVHISCEGTA